MTDHQHIDQHYRPDHEDPGQKHSPDTGRRIILTEHSYHREVFRPHPNDHRHGARQHRQVQPQRQQLIGPCHLRRRIAEHQQVFELLQVLLQHQENTQQQNEEGEYGNQQPHADHHSRRHAQKVARPAFVAGTSFDLVAVERKVFMDPVVRSVPHLQNDPRRIGRRFIGEPTVRPADELLRNEDRIQAVGKSHDTPLEFRNCPRPERSDRG